MHPAMVSRILGLFLMVFSATLLVPIAVALAYGEDTHGAFFLSFAITYSLGMLMWLPFSRRPLNLRTRDGFVVTTLFWVVLGLVGAMPLMLMTEVHLSFTNAVFESISGLTTTGATVMTGLDHMPRSILYYRQQLHWLGGIGIVVIAVAIMPMLGVGGMQLYRAEMMGPAKEAKMTPRIAQTAKVLFIIYVALTAACALAFWLAGMSVFDAVTHSFSTIATGGFSNYDASLGYFRNNVIYTIAVVFMILAGASFGLHYYTWVKGSIRHYWRNPESKLYLQIIAAGSVITVLYLLGTGHHDAENSVVHGTFQLVSIIYHRRFQYLAHLPAVLPAGAVVFWWLCGIDGRRRQDGAHAVSGQAGIPGTVPPRPPQWRLSAEDPQLGGGGARHRFRLGVLLRLSGGLLPVCPVAAGIGPRLRHRLVRHCRHHQ